MRKLARQIVLWSAFLLMPAAVQGQVIDDYQGFLSDGEEYSLDFRGSGDAVVSSRSLNGMSVYVGPYTGRLSSSGVTSASFSIICVDFEARAGDQNVVVTSLGDAAGDADLFNTRLGTASGSFNSYRRAAYYASLFDSWTTLGANQRTVWTDIHSMIWSNVSNSFSDGGVQTAFDLNAWETFSLDGWYLLTSTDSPHFQEMLVRGPTASVPEPSTYLLMATGLAFLAVLGRRRKLQIEA